MHRIVKGVYTRLYKKIIKGLRRKPFFLTLTPFCVKIIKMLKNEDKMKKVNVYTDGACSGNPGPGGWAAVLVCEGKEKAISGGEADTTNNRMELTAVVTALNALKYPCEVEITSDSKYVVDAISKGWLDSWRKKNWRKSDGKPALNVDLWERLIPELERHTVKFNWIKGHDGHEYNERCDKMAVEESVKYGAKK
jgi:ribonuclease HI